MKRLGNAEIALAMELKSQGCRYSVIAWHLGVVPSTLWKSIWRARKEGMVFGDANHRRGNRNEFGVIVR